MATSDLAVRINGVLPDVPTSSGNANTSASIFYNGFHLLVDAGSGVSQSLKSISKDLGNQTPDAILITHAEKEHVSDLDQFPNTKVFCTEDCKNQIIKMQSGQLTFVSVQPNQSFEVGPFSITPIAAENAGESAGYPGSVIYVIKAGESKITAGWDFLSLVNADDNLLWNPDLLLLGTETYNEHQSTGMISVIDAYNLVRKWNAKDCYILHYSGEKDVEDKRNQWHRGPVGPLTPDELQKILDDHLRATGHGGKFSITVARQAMVWRPSFKTEDEGPVGTEIEVEALEKYVIGLEKLEGKVAVSIEDSINRLTTEFANPRQSDDGMSLDADAIKSMMMKGPDLHLKVSESSVRIDITKGKKPMFAEDIPINSKDAQKLSRFIKENF
ncbi:MAG: hypothetical protein DA330_08615 [Nitrososphaera sp.]|nr:hypothetical protein [Nitrososphaera sp.]